jgi:hypothetical protein
MFPAAGRSSHFSTESAKNRFLEVYWGKEAVLKGAASFFRGPSPITRSYTGDLIPASFSIPFFCSVKLVPINRQKGAFF